MAAFDCCSALALRAPHLRSLRSLRRTAFSSHLSLVSLACRSATSPFFASRKLAERVGFEPECPPEAKSRWRRGLMLRLLFQNENQYTHGCGGVKPKTSKNIHFGQHLGIFIRVRTVPMLNAFCMPFPMLRVGAVPTLSKFAEGGRKTHSQSSKFQRVGNAPILVRNFAPILWVLYKGGRNSNPQIFSARNLWATFGQPLDGGK